MGGAAGALIAYYGFNGIRASTMNLSSFSQITFAFTVTPALVVQSLIYALVLGFFGGLMPSLRAASAIEHQSSSTSSADGVTASIRMTYTAYHR